MLLAFILYAPLIFLGYGSDNDTYGVLDAGKYFLETGLYVPSRNPGCIVHEGSTLLLSRIGGSILTNLGTLIMSMIAVGSFLYICERFAVPHYKYLTVLMIIHPLYWVNSTCTIDYLWALGFILAGFALCLDHRYALAGVLMGLAIGSRLSSFILVGGILALFLLRDREHRRQLYGGILLTGLIGGLCYVPSCASYNWTLDFLTPGIGGPQLWTPHARLGRFFYKNIYFWGLPATIFLSVVIFLSIKNYQNLLDKKWFDLSALSLLMILSYEALFLKYPVESEYFIVMLPFCLFLIGIGLKEHPKIILTLAILSASYNFVNFNIAKPDVPGQATTGTFGFWIEKGYLIDDSEQRFHLRHCDSLECWNKVMH